jgi:hypothetical protein
MWAVDQVSASWGQAASRVLGKKQAQAQTLKPCGYEIEPTNVPDDQCHDDDSNELFKRSYVFVDSPREAP